MPQRSKQIHVAIAVIERKGRYLISRRYAHDHLGGYWEFPGGKRKVGESWDACLRRELQEELDITVSPLGRLPSMSFRYPDRQIHLAVFRCALVKGDPKPLDCQQFRWVQGANLSRYRFPPADRLLIRQLSHSHSTLLRRRGQPAILKAPIHKTRRKEHER